MATKKSAPKKEAKVPAKSAVKKVAVPAKKTATSAKVTKSAPAVKKAAAKPTPAKKAAPVKKVAAPVKKEAPKKAAPASAKKVAVPVKKSPAKAASVKPVVPAKPTTKKEAAPTKKAPSVTLPAKPKAKEVKAAPAKPVVMPKIKTKTARKYEPDFTQSILNTTKKETEGPLVRYSDTDLQEFRELIQRKLESAKKELNYLQGLITRNDETGGDDSDSRYMTMEDGSLSMEREQLSQMASRQITFIDHLEKALVRIENKTYGICRVTGKLIDKARLRAVPHATLSIEAKLQNNR